MGRMEEFRAFVNKYPKIRDDVLNGNKTWQNIYEDFVILGPDSDIWNKYKETKSIKWLLVSFLLPTILGILICLVFNTICEFLSFFF